MLKMRWRLVSVGPRATFGLAVLWMLLGRYYINECGIVAFFVSTPGMPKERCHISNVLSQGNKTTTISLAACPSNGALTPSHAAHAGAEPQLLASTDIRSLDV
jgi:hypothetical protein